MSLSRTTVYLDEKIYRAAKVKSAVTSKSLSDIVSQALIFSLREDQADLSAFSKRQKEPSHPFEDTLKELRADGLL